MNSRWNGFIAPALIFLSLLLLSHCKGEKKDEPSKAAIAEAYEERLTRSELRKKVPKSLSHVDSQTIAKNLKRDWVRERVLLREAKERLSEEKKDLSERIQAYRRELLIHLMEQKIIQKELDTNVMRKDLLSYYKEHQKEFILSEPALKYLYVELVQDSVRYLDRFMNALRKDSKQRASSLYSLCRDHAVDCSINTDQWKRIGEFLNRMPFNIKNEARFLKREGVQRYEKEGNIFLLRIVEHRAKKSIAPLKMVEDRVRSMILNERREKLVERVHQKALIDARENNEVQIYDR